jgi:hypothetical protein
MKKSIIGFLLTIVLVFGLAGGASADILTGDWYLNYYVYPFDGDVFGYVEFGLDQFNEWNPNVLWEEEIRINLDGTIYMEPLGTSDTQVWNLELSPGEEVIISLAGLNDLATFTPNAVTGSLTIPDGLSVDFLAAGVVFESSEHTVPVPEPATMLLLGIGLIGIAMIGRKEFFSKK